MLHWFEEKMCLAFCIQYFVLSEFRQHMCASYMYTSQMHTALVRTQGCRRVFRHHGFVLFTEACLMQMRTLDCGGKTVYRGSQATELAAQTLSMRRLMVEGWSLGRPRRTYSNPTYKPVEAKQPATAYIIRCWSFDAEQATWVSDPQSFGLVLSFMLTQAVVRH